MSAMSRPASRILPLLLLLTVLLPSALGWGDVGHTLIGRIAMSQLTPAATTLLVDLAPSSTAVQSRPDGPNPNATVAGNISDPGIGSWPDRVRYTSSPFVFTDTWHYFNTRDWQCQYDAALDCPATGCVNTAIHNYYTQRTADKTLTLQERQYALAFLTHFIEDLHQPLHGGFASDQDGNSISGTFATASSTYPRVNLHAMWDTSMIATRIARDFSSGGSDQYYQYLLRALATQYNESVAGWRTCSAGTVYAGNYGACSDDWSQETARLACSTAYTTPSNVRLTMSSTLTPVSSTSDGEQYYQSAIPVIERRLMQAGVRLANVLNNIAAGNTAGTTDGGSSGGGNSGGGSSGGNSGGGDEGGVSKGAVAFMAVLIVALALALLMFCALYYRKEKLGLPSLFTRGSGGSMGLIGGGGDGYTSGYGGSSGGGARQSLL